MKKRIILASEKKERVVIRKRKPLMISVCGECARKVEWLNLDEAVTISGKNAKRILREIEEGEIHSTENETGHLFCCPNSIL